VDAMLPREDVAKFVADAIREIWVVGKKKKKRK
jgi:hypothetical protein